MGWFHCIYTYTLPTERYSIYLPHTTVITGYLREKRENGDPGVTSHHGDSHRGHVQAFGVCHKLVGSHHVQRRDPKYTEDTEGERNGGGGF